jgi:hypothetical protein
VVIIGATARAATGQSVTTWAAEGDSTERSVKVASAAQVASAFGAADCAGVPCGQSPSGARAVPLEFGFASDGAVPLPTGLSVDVATVVLVAAPLAVGANATAPTTPPTPIAPIMDATTAFRWKVTAAPRSLFVPELFGNEISVGRARRSAL